MRTGVGMISRATNLLSTYTNLTLLKFASPKNEPTHAVVHACSTCCYTRVHDDIVLKHICSCDNYVKQDGLETYRQYGHE